jgi:hypothetical protein
MDDGQGGDFTSIQGFSPSSMARHFTVRDNVLKGRAHRFRYRARNAVGWGPFSSEATVRAAERPSRPEPPRFSGFDSGTLTVTISPSADNGGSALLATALEVDAGDDYTSAFSGVTGYDGASASYGLTAGAEGLVLGRTYRLRTRSTNAVGASDYSLVAYVAFGGVPGAPSAPQRVGSTRTSVTVRWDPPAPSADPAEDLAVAGYVLSMDDGVHSHLAPVYVGQGRPQVVEYTASGLVTGRPYLFSVQAINQNGLSAPGPSASYYACVAPPALPKPTYVSSDVAAKTITVEWASPEDNGGCAVLGYRLYRTDGSSDPLDGSEPGTQVASLADSDPNLRSHTTDLSAGTVGHLYKFKVEARNAAGATDSSSLAVALASLPSEPSAAPTSDASITSAESLGLLIAPLGTDAAQPGSDGGSPVLQYELQFDDGARGPYRSVFTLSPLVVVSEGVARGSDHRVRYRAMNFNGWGPFSAVAYILAAGAPVPPAAPTFLSSTETHITLSLSPTPDDGGAPVTAYELYVDSLESALPAFALVSSAMTTTRVIEFAPPAGSTPAEVTAWDAARAGTVLASLTAGGQYRLMAKAVNQFGASGASEELRVAFARLPSQPAAPFKVESGSSESSLLLAWAQSSAVDGAPTEGYTLYMDDGHHGDLEAVYAGRLYPETLSFLVTNLTTGLPYRFSVAAHNANGESVQSPAATVYACLRPSGLAAPEVSSTTRDSIAVTWGEPAGNGCPITGFTLLRNTGADDAATISVDPSVLREAPSLRAHVIGGLTAVSSSYRIVVRAHNNAGAHDSPPRVVVLAAVPDTPAAAPSSLAAITDGTRIGVSFGPLAAGENGGSDVLSYELQMDAGSAGPFRALVGSEDLGDSLETTFTIGEGIVEGGLYRFRFRARNVNGWSQYSPVAYIRAARRPGRPEAPVRGSVDASGFTVQLTRTGDDGGGAILRYELRRNQGTGTLDEVTVATYDGHSDSHTLTVAADALVAGQVYSIRSVAVNAFGASEASEALVVGLAGYPAAPATLEKREEASGSGYVTLAWAASADTALPVLGY